MNSQYFETNKEWVSWLEKHHLSEKELWLIYYKKHSGKPGITYEDSVRTALCYGWIDGLVKRIDDECYARKFTPRKAKSLWSESNKKRVTELLKEGKMTPAGLKLIEAAKQNGNWDKVITRPEIDLSMPPEFEQALNKHSKAAAYFNSLNDRHQKEYLMWIKMAKREETRDRRIKKSVEMLLEKQKLGLK